VSQATFEQSVLLAMRELLRPQCSHARRWMHRARLSQRFPIFIFIYIYIYISIYDIYISILGHGLGESLEIGPIWAHHQNARSATALIGLSMTLIRFLIVLFVWLIVLIGEYSANWWLGGLAERRRAGARGRSGPPSH
jgi:hypothetical protein